MIVTEERLAELFDQIPSIQVNSSTSLKPVFSWGKKEVLNKWVEQYESKTYPLIWLLPSEESYNSLSGFTTRRVILIIAHLETRVELFNADRYSSSYDNVLNPLTNYVIQALSNSTITRLINSDDIKIFKEPNYSDREKNGSIDLWDAVRIECDVEFNNNNDNNCLNIIKWT